MVKHLVEHKLCRNQRLSYFNLRISTRSKTSICSQSFDKAKTGGMFTSKSSIQSGKAQFRLERRFLSGKRGAIGCPRWRKCLSWD